GGRRLLQELGGRLGDLPQVERPLAARARRGLGQRHPHSSPAVVARPDAHAEEAHPERPGARPAVPAMALLFGHVRLEGLLAAVGAVVGGGPFAHPLSLRFPRRVPPGGAVREARPPYGTPAFTAGRPRRRAGPPERRSRPRSGA